MNEETKIIRTCANCACQLTQIHPVTLAPQMFCRKSPPISQVMRTERPRMRDGKSVMQRDGKTPLMESGQEIVYLYAPTQETLVCFDGWRPEGTEPGERSSTEFGASITNAMLKLHHDMVHQLNEEPKPEDFAPLDHIDDTGKTN